jgi:hypothetical protein
MALSQRLIARAGQERADGTAAQLTRTAAHLTRTATHLTRTGGGGGGGGGGRSNKLVSCPNIAVKCDVVEYL